MCISRAYYGLEMMVDSLQELFYLVFMAMYEVDNDNVSILQMRILRHREVKQFAQDHTPNERQPEFQPRPFVIRALVLHY